MSHEYHTWTNPETFADGIELGDELLTMVNGGLDGIPGGADGIPGGADGLGSIPGGADGLGSTPGGADGLGNTPGGADGLGSISKLLASLPLLGGGGIL